MSEADSNHVIRVLHVVGEMDRGGTETLLMTLLRILNKDKFQYDFVEQTERKCSYDDEIVELGSKIYRCPKISPFSLNRYRNWWRRFYKEHPEYAIIHGHSRGSAPIYLSEAKKAGLITIAHCHNNSYGRGIKGLIRQIWQMPLRHLADYNLACSWDSGISQYGKNSTFSVIKNGIDSEKFAFDPAVRKRMREEYGLTDKFVVGNVARFVEQKNHAFLLEIFKRILDLQPSAILFLIGSGPLMDDIKRRAADLDILDKVVFSGEHSNMPDYYQMMDVFVLPSLFEGLGIVNIEAQCSGLPCVVSSTVAPEAGITDLLSYQSLSNSPESWALSVLEKAKLFSERQSRRDEIQKNGFDIRMTAHQLQDMYEKIVIKKRY